MITYLFLWLIVIPGVLLGGGVYASQVIQARRHDHTSSWGEILTSELRALAGNTRDAITAGLPKAVRWMRGKWHGLLVQFTEGDAPGDAEDASGHRPPVLRIVADEAVPVAALPDLPDDIIDPGEAQAISGSIVPADWAAVISRIAMFEPEDDTSLIEFIRAEAAAFGPLADAWRSLGDTLINVIGTDPAAGAGVFDLADVLGEAAHDVALAQRRFVAVYAQVIEAVAGGLRLPHSGRWLTGGSA